MSDPAVCMTYTYGFGYLGPEKQGLATTLDGNPLIVELGFTFFSDSPSRQGKVPFDLKVMAVFDKGTASLFELARRIPEAQFLSPHMCTHLDCDLSPVPGSLDHVYLSMCYRVETESSDTHPDVIGVGMELLALLKKYAGVVWDPLPVPELVSQSHHYLPDSAEADAMGYVDQDTYFVSRFGCKSA